MPFAKGAKATPTCFRRCRAALVFIAPKERSMFESQKTKIVEYRNRKVLFDILWVALKLAIAFALIEFLDYGIYIVIGYILYSVESCSSLLFINSQEVDLQLNAIHQRINDIELQLVNKSH